jgi:NitT/TauT family transport system substrate-binding protein/putative hydroxymethylpyrimidine transport system substrate-binding protein
MRRVAALLAAVVAFAGLGACGDDGAEPGAPEGATLVLDFTPNAAHAGIYAALERGLYRTAGVELGVREPGESSDAPKLLEAGRADFAILDIHDLGIAREAGLDVVGVLPIVQRPLAAVIARADAAVRRPRDLEGRTAGVTGLPSDEAVLDSVVAGDGGDPARVDRVTIGFNAVAALAGGRVDAVTAFWNAEGVALRRQGVPTRVFRVDGYGAPRYPELVLCTSRETLVENDGLVRRVVAATERGYRLVAARPEIGLEALLDANPELDRADQAAQLRALGDALRPRRWRGGLPVLLDWLKWDVQHGILDGRFGRLMDAFALR